MAAGIISVNPTIVLDAYTAGDVVGSLMEFTRPDNLPGAIAFNQVVITDVDQAKEGYTVHIFSDKPTVIADAAEYATGVVIADLNIEVKQVTVATGDYVDTGTIGSSAFKAFDPVYSQNPKGSIWMYLEATATPEHATLLALTINLHYVSL